MDTPCGCQPARSSRTARRSSTPTPGPSAARAAGSRTATRRRLSSSDREHHWGRGAQRGAPPPFLSLDQRRRPHRATPPTGAVTDPRSPGPIAARLTGASASATINEADARPACRGPRTMRGQSGAEAWCETAGTQQGRAVSWSYGATWRRELAGQPTQTDWFGICCKGAAPVGAGGPFFLARLLPRSTPRRAAEHRESASRQAMSPCRHPTGLLQPTDTAAEQKGGDRIAEAADSQPAGERRDLSLCCLHTRSARYLRR
jgi:hypothetical protein